MYNNTIVIIVSVFVVASFRCPRNNNLLISKLRICTTNFIVRTIYCKFCDRNCGGIKECWQSIVDGIFYNLPIFTIIIFQIISGCKICFVLNSITNSIILFINCLCNIRDCDVLIINRGIWCCRINCNQTFSCCIIFMIRCNHIVAIGKARESKSFITIAFSSCIRCGLTFDPRLKSGSQTIAHFRTCHCIPKLSRSFRYSSFIFCSIISNCFKCSRSSSYISRS